MDGPLLYSIVYPSHVFRLIYGGGVLGYISVFRYVKLSFTRVGMEVTLSLPGCTTLPSGPPESELAKNQQRDTFFCITKTAKMGKMAKIVEKSRKF